MCCVQRIRLVENQYFGAAYERVKGSLKAKGRRVDHPQRNTAADTLTAEQVLGLNVYWFGCAAQPANLPARSSACVAHHVVLRVP